MIELITTVASVDQAKAMLAAGVDTIYFGEETFGLRLPYSFSRTEQQELVNLAHAAGKKAAIAVNGIMHPEKMKIVPEYLAFVKEIGTDQIVVGDPGVVYVMMQDEKLATPFIYDGETLVTSARQINFWGKKGAVGAVLAREVPFAEMKELAPQLTIPTEVLVYGATCIHQSKRPLLQNYYNYTKQDESTSKERNLFLSEPKKPETHYSIYEDSHGTHIFADNDVDLMNELAQLAQTGFRTWKLEGLFTDEENFVAVAQLFVTAKAAILAGTWDETQAKALDEKLRALHPDKRGLDTGFYYLDPNKIR
ncbi:peptidase U32 family protein [Enterococcus dispar]|uniref:Peptidase U32 n=1 Tax=Enterococcus dispar ATCC 51266 TaxID=1139219 RepID=S1NBH3_9ENTE|nr:peptidase U32 family protein [Enterococcus dispar]EOT39195.1 peptidase U32 [Enterococcus dispar ATCC 51266]EOW86390.1 peptidase U32 [Enterococcus dispar ATCC 51266]MCU7357315.1 U32 family peptidase [Enterococcus dispar]MDT2705382.1 U32 family peptidase [Enterococcus dispar]OJG38237.1 peptidase U32 [Enterococcus dispar]